MRLLLVVPARSGSKGIPNKNLHPFSGQPLIEHVLATALKVMDRIPASQARLIVSTDSREIAEVARSCGAEVPFLRPQELAKDDSSMMDVVMHALRTLHGQERYEPDTIALLQPTSPLVSVDDILGALLLFSENGHPVVSVTEHEHPLDWIYSMEDNVLKPIIRNSKLTRRQDTLPLYRLNGAVYVSSVAQLRRDRKFLVSETLGYRMAPDRSIDIDSELDLALGELILSRCE